MRTQPVKKLDEEQQQRLIAEQRVRKAQEDLKKINKKKFQEEAAKLDLDPTKLYYARQKVANTKKTHPQPQSLRIKVCNEEILHAFLENENQKDPNFLADYLKNCDIKTKQQDLNIALMILKKYIDPDNKGVSEDTDWGKFYTYVLAHKDTISAEILPSITELAAREIFKIRCQSTLIINQQEANHLRMQQVIREIYHSEEKIVAKCFLSAEEENALKLDLMRDRVAEIQKKHRIAQPFRDNACSQEMIHAFLENEVPVQERLAEYLENCGDNTKKQDLNVVLDMLKDCIDPKNRGITKDTDLGKYYLYLQQNKNNIPVEKLPYVTEITARVVFKIKMPEHSNNQPDGWNIHHTKTQINKVYNYTWGKIIGGLILSILFGAGVPLVIEGLKEKKFNDYANGLFKPTIQPLEENKNMLERKTMYELLEGNLITENNPPYHRKVSSYVNRLITPDEQNKEMKEALANFHVYIQTLPKDNIFVKIYTELNQLSKKISANKKTALTEQIVRLLFLAKHPDNLNNAQEGVNIARSKFLANEIAPPVRKLFSGQAVKSHLWNLIDQAFNARSQLAAERILRSSIN